MDKGRKIDGLVSKDAHLLAQLSLHRPTGSTLLLVVQQSICQIQRNRVVTAQRLMVSRLFTEQFNGIQVAGTSV